MDTDIQALEQRIRNAFFRDLRDMFQQAMEYTLPSALYPPCTLANEVESGKSYAVALPNMTLPLSVFICRHCAMKWRDETFRDAEIQEHSITLRSVFPQGSE